MFFARLSQNHAPPLARRWADRAAISEAGLFADRGIMLGQAHGRYLRHDGPEHVLMVAPTRSGKGVGLVVPTLLSWTGSAIIHDIIPSLCETDSFWRFPMPRKS